MAGSAMAGKYDIRLDRESAAEILVRRAADAAAAAKETDAESRSGDPAKREHTQARRYGAGVVPSRGSPARRRETVGGALTSALVRELNGATGRRLVRGLLGGLFRGR